MYFVLLATVSLKMAQLNLEGSARYWCFSFSVSNCHAFQKFMSSLLWLNKKSSILRQSRRYAAHSVHCACSICCQRLALLSVFISRGLFLFPLLLHSQPTYCLCCFHFLAELLFFSKKENRFLPPSSFLASVLVAWWCHNFCPFMYECLHSDSNLENIQALGLL